MLRRCASFARHPYAQAIMPSADDEDDILHAKWTAWVHQESLKRYGRCQKDVLERAIIYLLTAPSPVEQPHLHLSRTFAARWPT